MQQYEYILFDADNTLFDFDAAEHHALMATLTHYGFPADGETESRYLAINRALWDRFDAGEVTRDFLVVERFAALQRILGGNHDPAEVNAYYLARLGERPDLLPGAEELCRDLAPRYTLAIVTNGVTSAQRGRYARSALARYIPHLFISQELGCQKPQRAFFDQVLAALAAGGGARAVVVGDSLSADIQGAINAGLDSIWYNPNRLPGRPETRPTYEADSFDAIRGILLGG